MSLLILSREEIREEKYQSEDLATDRQPFPQAVLPLLQQPQTGERFQLRGSPRRQREPDHVFEGVGQAYVCRVAVVHESNPPSYQSAATGAPPISLHNDAKQAPHDNARADRPVLHQVQGTHADALTDPEDLRLCRGGPSSDVRESGAIPMLQWPLFVQRDAASREAFQADECSCCSAKDTRTCSETRLPHQPHHDIHADTRSAPSRCID